MTYTMKSIAFSTALAILLGSLFIVPATLNAEEVVPPVETQEVPQETQEQTQESQTETPPVGDNGEAGLPDSGENGANDGETPIEEGDGTDGLPDGEANLDTGNATSTIDVDNSANTNVEDVPEHASSTISNTNEADSSVTATGGASTGTNTAEGEGGAKINTGNAVATANVINVVNTNIINSTGILAFLNAIFGGGFDLRNFDLSYFFGGPSQTGCSLDKCDSGSLSITNGNNATVNNDITVTAQTGANTALSGSGNASIATGDAYAAGNVINVVNTNIVNSNYLLIAANNFGDMAGDIILPDADFFSQLLKTSMQGSLPNSTSIGVSNTASVTDNLSATADSGQNTSTTDGGTAGVSTGNAVAQTNSVNQVNTTAVGGTTFYMLVNVLGDWSGSVYGLPQGITWSRTPTGILLTSETGAMPGSGCCDDGILSVHNSNQATLNNDVKVYALTGDNYAHSSEGDASISTGNAYAAANVFNIVNSSVVGQNWMFAVFNIFGNWSGNIAFGQPDLWVGAIAETSSPTMPGASVTYKFTVANRGLSEAKNVVFRADFPSRYLKFTNANPNQRSDGSMLWNLGNMSPGETRELSYSAVAGVVDYGQEALVPLIASVGGDNGDADLADNTERVAIVVGEAIKTYGTADKDVWTLDPGIHVKKTASVSTTTIPANIDYKVVVVNTGGEAYDATLTDTLKDPKGKTLYKRTWDLETIKPGEEITLTYTIEYGGGLDFGSYTNTARIEGTKNNSADAYATSMKPVEVKHVLKVTGKKAPKVLGASTKKLYCEEYITDYLMSDEDNDPVLVRKLKIFLNVFQKENLELNGTYDAATVSAVERFQIQHQDEVLSPWGIGEATGNVYYTTRKLINEMYCESIDKKAFPLSEEQENEILAFRNIYGFGSGLATGAVKPEEIVEETRTAPMPKLLLRDLFKPTAEKYENPPFMGLIDWGSQLFSAIPAQAHTK